MLPSIVSIEEHDEPECHHVHADSLALVVTGKAKDLGGFEVRRVLPAIERRNVGPFVFFDEMGPAEFPVGAGIDVRPHPHIGLATLTYLFEGEILHQDSVGSHQVIRPGDVNWMVAGTGIVHSERTPAEARVRARRLHGLQTWLALPQPHEETTPRFEHHPSATLPTVDLPGARVRVLAGTALGVRAPTGTFGGTLYAHVDLDADATFALDTEHAERAVYVVSGEIELEGRRFTPGAMLVLTPDREARLSATCRSDVMLVGGASLDAPRHLVWNFVSSSKERLERAKHDWVEDRFPKVPGDAEERIPLPEALVR
jgi:redox-sensitive bicupin YhaK (pirin superfamily)